MKNNCVVNKKIKGSNSKINAGELRKVKKIGFRKLTFRSLKNSISDIKFKIKERLNIIKEIKINDFKKLPIRNFVYIFIYLIFY